MALVQLRCGSFEFWYPGNASRHYVGSEIWALSTPDHPHYYQKGETVVESEDVVLDVGACEGFFSKSVVDRCKAVHLFEPVPVLVECLGRTFADLQGTKVFVVRCALGRSVGIQVMNMDTGDYQGSHAAGNDHADGRTRLDAPMTTIDRWAEENRIGRVDFIKVDAEGSDLEVLEGAHDTICRFLPKIAVATYHRPEHASAMAEYIVGISPLYRVTFSGTSHAWLDCRPLLGHFWVDPALRRKRIFAAR
jgi:FkbM family methyltransferase